LSWTGDARRDVASVLRLLYERGLVQVRGGNASIHDPARGLVYMSPTGVPRNLVGPEHVALVSLDGRIVSGSPTSEWRMHLSVYHAAAGARAVVHAHPRAVLALMHSRVDLDPGLASEAGLQVECVGRVPFLRPGSAELAEAVGREAARGCNVILLEGHGVVVWSPATIYHALDLLEAVEDLAWIQLHARPPA